MAKETKEDPLSAAQPHVTSPASQEDDLLVAQRIKVLRRGPGDRRGSRGILGYAGLA
ncbi:hypothetical protein ACHAO4_010302 [Trichoderma viride]